MAQASEEARMTINQAAARLRSAMRALARALSAGAPKDAGAWSRRDDGSVFQPHVASLRAAARTPCAGDED